MANIFATLGRFFGQKVISAADEFADILDNLEQIDGQSGGEDGRIGN
jgi:hypothetical protein